MRAVIQRVAKSRVTVDGRTSGEIQRGLMIQFTLLGDVRKGKRPSFSSAARPEEADRLYQKVIEDLRQDGLHVEEGVFQAHMMVDILNDGPVTILLDSRKNF